MRNACRLQCLSLIAVASGLGCVSYRDRIVYVREHTLVEGPAAATQVNVNVQVSLWQLPATPPRLDAPTLRRALDGFGGWVESPAYGTVWIPYDRDDDFTPYLTAGQWAPTRDGWYWQSDYAWGAITFHYGRWVRLGRVWAWVPGAVFAPAWVDWRSGGGWVAWAPLAPDGAAFSAQHVYCALAHLHGPGLFARTVRGPAAMALFPQTAPLRTVYGYGGTFYAPGPPVPPGVATGAERQWAANLPPPRTPSEPARTPPPGDAAAQPPAGPTRVPDIPSVPRVLTAATGTVRPRDSFAPPASLAEAPEAAPATAVEAPAPTGRVWSTTSLGYSDAPALRSDAPAPITAGGSGYTVLPARRMTWSSAQPIVAPASAPPVQTPPPTYAPPAYAAPAYAAPTYAPPAYAAPTYAPPAYAAPAYAAPRMMAPPVAVERSVAAPPALDAPVYGAPAAWRAPAYVNSPPVQGPPPAMPSFAGSSPAVYNGGYQPPVRANVGIPSAPTYVTAQPTPTPAQAPMFRPPTTITAPAAPVRSFGQGMSMPTVFAPGAGFPVR
jgi:hypothetical protein